MLTMGASNLRPIRHPASKWSRLCSRSSALVLDRPSTTGWKSTNCDTRSFARSSFCLSRSIRVSVQKFCEVGARVDDQLDPVEAELADDVDGRLGIGRRRQIMEAPAQAADLGLARAPAGASAASAPSGHAEAARAVA